MHLRFTDIAISRLKTCGLYYDETTPAFGIRVGKNRKTWFVVRGRERSRTAIGRYPDKPVADARREAKMLLAQPVTKNEKVTVENAYQVFRVHIETKKPRTQLDYRRLLTTYFLPLLGTKKLGDITYEDVIACVDGVSPGEANHALVIARLFFRWCVRPPRRYIPHSPLEGVEIVPPKRRKRVLSKPELKAVWKAAGAQGYPHGVLVQLLLLTGQRRGEIANLRWPWINSQDRLITLPEWVCKNSKEHVFPYGQMTANLLESIPRLNSTPLLFPSWVSDERPISGWSKFKDELDELIKGETVEHYTLHDLRRTYRTLHAEIGTPANIGERLINHVAAVTTDVEIIYDRYNYLKEMQAAVENFDARFSQLIAA
jgi:integrase